MKIDKKIIKELSDYLDEFNLTELEYTEKDTKIKVSKNKISVSGQSAPASNANTSIESPKIVNNIKSGIQVTSPIIGTAYHAPEPGAKKFVEVGKKIKKGDTVMIVEATCKSITFSGGTGLESFAVSWKRSLFIILSCFQMCRYEILSYYTIDPFTYL